MAAYLESPNDPELASRLGFIHLWKITERARVKPVSPLVTNEVILSKKYFSDALQLDPNNAIYKGFYGDARLIEGHIFKDQQEEVRGYFVLKDAIHKWPEFNYFTAGYVMSTLDKDSKQFKEGLEGQWKTLDLCAGRRVNRYNPDYRSFMQRETLQGPQRACWDSPIAPHNFEGFFMNMGDMLVKSGDSETAVKIYQNAKLAKNYSIWPYKEMLEKRILHAKTNISAFRANGTDPDKTILLNSGYGCVVCHQKSKS
jgi:hypothetical protein